MTFHDLNVDNKIQNTAAKKVVGFPIFFYNKHLQWHYHFFSNEYVHTCIFLDVHNIFPGDTTKTLWRILLSYGILF